MPMTTDEAIGQVIQTAKTELGTREAGHSNTGGRVEQYQAVTTLGGTGWPWCAAFVAWVMKYALGDDVAKEVWLPSASCDQILDWARRRGIVRTEPSPGDVFLVMASKNNATHTGFVTGVHDGLFNEISGNTNNDGSREGNGVYARTRPISDHYLFIHWTNLLPNPALWSIRASDGHEMGQRISREGAVYVEARVWGEWFNKTTGWDSNNQQVLYDGVSVDSQIKLIDGVAWLPIRALAKNQGLNISLDANAKVIMLSKAPKKADQ